MINAVCPFDYALPIGVQRESNRECRPLEVWEVEESVPAQQHAFFHVFG